jgi:DNA-binding NarL/FixJ family response regulator
MSRIAWAGLLVIVLSAYDDDALRAAAREAGAAGYVAKGTDPALLCDTIRRIGSIATGVRR